MSNTCPTVKVKADNEQGFMVINESDFDAAAHAPFVTGEPVTEPASDTPKKRKQKEE